MKIKDYQRIWGTKRSNRETSLPLDSVEKSLGSTQSYEQYNNTANYDNKKHLDKILDDFF